MNLFFDLDGTLTDPKEGILACIRYALSSLEIEIDETIDFERFIGPPLQDTFRELCADEHLAKRALHLYRERFSKIGLYENRLYDGITDCLEALRPSVRACYVVTSKPTVFSERIIDHFNLREHFAVVYGSNLDGSLGDKTELIAHVLDQEGLQARDCTMIGDRKYDVIGAKNHNIKSIAVLWGYGSEHELRGAGADSFCESPFELCKHILSEQV